MNSISDQTNIERWNKKNKIKKIKQDLSQLKLTHQILNPSHEMKIIL